ncbi:MAG: hypothetical protein MJK04_23025, partial [Psychrosphaera sp.]|nr:hypothetical protein [Psychrosphaera sp.]
TALSVVYVRLQDVGGRAMQEHIAENNYTALPLPCIKRKQTAAKINSKDQQALAIKFAKNRF